LRISHKYFIKFLLFAKRKTKMKNLITTILTVGFIVGCSQAPVEEAPVEEAAPMAEEAAPMAEEAVAE
jgi:PBP1b-binding outer membrane lipoprotein LpoB